MSAVSDQPQFEHDMLLLLEEVAIKYSGTPRGDTLWAAVRAMQPPAEYRVAVRPDHKGHVDDVVVNDVSCFRMEDMGSSWWVCCYLAGEDPDNRICFDIAHRGGRAVLTERPNGVVWEEGSL